MYATFRAVLSGAGACLAGLSLLACCLSWAVWASGILGPASALVTGLAAAFLAVPLAVLTAVFAVAIALPFGALWVTSARERVLMAWYGLGFHATRSQVRHAVGFGAMAEDVVAQLGRCAPTSSALLGYVYSDRCMPPRVRVLDSEARRTNYLRTPAYMWRYLTGVVLFLARFVVGAVGRTTAHDAALDDDAFGAMIQHSMAALLVRKRSCALEGTAAAEYVVDLRRYGAKIAELHRDYDTPLGDFHVLEWPVIVCEKSRDDAALRVTAVETQGDKVYTRDTAGWDLAKTHAMAALLSACVGPDHVGYHFTAEILYLATVRHFAADHPLYRLLEPHIVCGILAIDKSVTTAAEWSPVFASYNFGSGSPGYSPQNGMEKLALFAFAVEDPTFWASLDSAFSPEHASPMLDASSSVFGLTYRKYVAAVSEFVDAVVADWAAQDGLLLAHLVHDFDVCAWASDLAAAIPGFPSVVELQKDPSLLTTVLVRAMMVGIVHSLKHVSLAKWTSRCPMTVRLPLTTPHTPGVRTTLQTVEDAYVQSLLSQMFIDYARNPLSSLLAGLSLYPFEPPPGYGRYRGISPRAVADFRAACDDPLAHPPALSVFAVRNHTIMSTVDY